MRKNFTFPVMILAVLLVFAVISIVTGMHISMLQEKFKKDIEQQRINFINKQKALAKEKIDMMVKSINFRKKQVQSRLENLIKFKTDNAVYVAENIYKKHKGKISNNEIKEIIKTYLSNSLFKSKNGYFFAVDMNTSKMLVHPVKRFLNSDISKYVDAKGFNAYEYQKKLLKKQDSGFHDIYFVKPNSKKQYKKRLYIKHFKPFNWLIGTGEYYDHIEKLTKKEALRIFTDLSYKDNRYSIIGEFNEGENGYKDFKILLNNNTPNLIGKKLSLDFEGAKGKKIIREFLNNYKNNLNGSYIEYWFKELNSDKISKKITYFYLHKDWNWLIGSGFYLKDFENEITKNKNEIEELTAHNIKNGLSMAFTLSVISILVAYIMASRINKMILKYTNKIHEINKELGVLNKTLQSQVDIAVENCRQQEQIIHDQKKLADMTQMISAIAHQWRQPLTALALNIQDIPDALINNEMDQEYITKFENDSMEMVNFLSATIDDFRNFFKPDKEKTEFDISKEIMNISRIVNTQFSTLNIDLITECKCNGKIESISKGEICPEGQTSVTGYLGEFKQAFINLLYNSSDSIQERQKNEKNHLGKISISIEGLKDSIIIIVSDNGIGIPEHILDKIFNPYYTTKEEGKGSGLGLYMTKIIIEKHLNGKITAANNEKGGATFKIVIPRNTKSSA